MKNLALYLLVFFASNGWIYAQTYAKILYDLFFGFIAMIVAKFTKKALWVAIG